MLKFKTSVWVKSVSLIKKVSYFTVVSVNKFCFLGKFYSFSQPISIHSDIERPRHFDHFGNVLNPVMCSVDNPKISLWEGRYN